MYFALNVSLRCPSPNFSANDVSADSCHVLSVSVLLRVSGEVQTQNLLPSLIPY